ncbi:thiol-disulfide isomerase/thioredoxin [Arthrobacter pigmenti]|uniref:Thiol-disulfide isomerase/thioredoxin n=2 Tax=Arthrobacter pigmenti TaxID=271432 RepID=A0A846RP83_9MICC|nr:thiol-disulfide isomerase/thioredoxin [Arthrobacter pigmenti]
MTHSDAAPRRRTIGRLMRLAAAVLAAAVVLSGCAAQDPLAQQAAEGNNKNYIAGDGSVTEYAPAERGEPVDIEGELYSGQSVNSTDWQGQVTVLNFWYAACAPCREEAPDLVALHEEFEPQGVQFYGVNIRDSKQNAEAFERTFGIPYPSFNDSDGGVLLSMTSYVPPQAVPTTIVLDQQGRVAARILGLADKGTLSALIETALAE